MLILAALIANSSDRARLRAALTHVARVRFVSRMSTLVAVVRRSRVDMIISEPRDGSGATLATHIPALRAASKCLPIVVHCRLAEDDSRSLMDLARAGADDVMLCGIDDAGTTVSRIWAQPSVARAARRLVEEVRPHVPATAFPIVAYCLEHASERPTVMDVASGIGVNRRTLVNRLSAMGLPAPGATLIWCRLLLAAMLLDTSNEPVGRIAAAVGFGSATAFRVACKRYTGLSPNALRATGGYTQALRMFLRSGGQGKDNAVA